MKTKTTTVRGLAVDVVVRETTQSDALGHLFYVAEILIRQRRTGAQHLVRRTRIPGAGQELAQAVLQRGLRALDTIATVRKPERITA